MSWPIDPKLIQEHDKKADAERKAKGLDYTADKICPVCKTKNGHTKECTYNPLKDS